MFTATRSVTAVTAQERKGTHPNQLVLTVWETARSSTSCCGVARRRINCANAAVEQVSSFTSRVKPVAGQGATRKERSLLVKTPPGIESGKSLRLLSQGECGLRGGPYGDLFVDVVVKSHPVLQRDGYDLRCQVPVGFATATLGGEIHIPTLTDPIALNLPRGTQPNQTFRLIGTGD